MSEIGQAFESIHERIDLACKKSGRSPEQIKLIAVSKTVEAERIRKAIERGQTVFGENKLQEAEEKIGLLPDTIDWHFIGQLQRNKVRKVLGLFGTIHSVDSVRIASSIDRIAKDEELKARVFIQVNIADEKTKGGFSVGEIQREFEGLLSAENLEILGLMAIPPAETDREVAREWFRKVRDLQDQLISRFGVPLNELSMGMSGDFEVAIEEGATMIRVGSAIFGSR